MRYAWASIGENGKATGGKAGNQSGKELKIGAYYSFGQKYYVRWKYAPAGVFAGKVAKYIAKSKNVGYNQNERAELYNLARSVNWDWSKFKKQLAKTKVNCDCSSMYATVINLTAGTKVVPCFTTATILDIFVFKEYKELATLYLKKGNISSGYKATHGDGIFKPNKHVIIAI